MSPAGIAYVEDGSERDLSARLRSLIPSGRQTSDPAAYFANNATINLLDHATPGTTITDGVTSAIAAMTAASSAAASSGRDLAVPPGLYNVSANFSFPSNVVVRPMRGAVFKIAAGVTLTLSRRPEGLGRWQVFDVSAGGRVAGGAYWDEVCPEWWGAVGNAYYLDTLGFQYYANSALTVLANDDTTAFKHAWAFAWNCQKPTFTRAGSGGTLFGNVTGMPPISLGARMYRITSPKVFSRQTYIDVYGVSPSGLPRWLAIQGVGREASRIGYENDDSLATDNYLIYNDNRWDTMYLGYCTFQAASQNERFFYMTSSGTAKRPIMEFVDTDRFREHITLAGTGNSDHAKLYGWNCMNLPAGGTGLLVNNSQSVSHDLDGCDVENCRGTFLKILAGGAVNVRGGSWIAKDSGRLWHVEDGSGVGTGVGTQNGILNIDGIKVELHQASTLGYLAAIAQVNISGTLDVVLSEQDGVPADTKRLTINGNGRVVVRNARWDYLVEVIGSLNVSSNSACKPEIIFEECTLYRPLADLVTISGAGQGDSGRASARNCSRGDNANVSTGSKEPADVDLNAFHGYSTRAPQLKRFAYQASNAAGAGLPSDAVAHSFFIPRGATRVRVGIFHSAAQSNSGTGFMYEVRDSAGNVLVTLGPTDSTARAFAVSTEDLVSITSDTEKELKIVKTAGTAVAQEGYAFVDYY